MITISDYKKITKTAVYPRKVDNFGIAYLTLGFYDELDEAYEKIALNADVNEVRKEIGDVFWYTVTLAEEAGLSFDRIIMEIFNETDTNPRKFNGLVKKYYRDGKALDVTFIEDSIISTFNHLLTLFCSLYPHQTMCFEEEVEVILDLNYQKLQHRLKTNTLHGDGDNR